MTERRWIKATEKISRLMKHHRGYSSVEDWRDILNKTYRFSKRLNPVACSDLHEDSKCLGSGFSYRYIDGSQENQAFCLCGFTETIPPQEELPK